MSKRRLSDLLVRNLQPRKIQYEVFDDVATGLSARISPGGKKTYNFLGRVRGRQVRISIGPCKLVTLKEAREQALDHARAMRRGIDPRVRRTLSGPVTVGYVAEHFIERYAKPNTATARETERILQREVVSRWGNLPLLDINRSAILAALDEIAIQSGQSSANHAFAAIRRLFTWALQRGMVETSPCFGLRQPFKMMARQRVLSDDELRRILDAAEELGFPYGYFVKLACLTAQRRGEVSKLAWADINLNDRVWFQKVNKARRPQIIPLSDTVIELLRATPRISEKVFPSSAAPDRSISGFSKWKLSLDSLSGVEGWTHHDLRRTAITNMGRLKVPSHIIDRILNHSSGQVRGLRGVYNLYEYMEEKREALERWEGHLQSLTRSR